jgi:hypothetical protein
MRNNNVIVVNKYSTLTRQVELYDTLYHIKDNALIAAMYRYLNTSNHVHLLSGDQYHLAGYIHALSGNEVTVDLLDNSYGSFVQRMLYHAVDYKLVARGLGQVSGNGKDLLGFKINNLFITSYTKWF